MKLEDITLYVQNIWQQPEKRYPALIGIAISGLFTFGASWIIMAVATCLILSVPVFRFISDLGTNVLGVVQNVNKTVENASGVVEETKKTVETARTQTLTAVNNVIEDGRTSYYPMTVAGRTMKWAGSLFAGNPKPATSPDTSSKVSNTSKEKDTADKVKANATNDQNASISLTQKAKNFIGGLFSRSSETSVVTDKDAKESTKEAQTKTKRTRSSSSTTDVTNKAKQPSNAVDKTTAKDKQVEMPAQESVEKPRTKQIREPKAPASNARVEVSKPNSTEINGTKHQKTSKASPTPKQAKPKASPTNTISVAVSKAKPTEVAKATEVPKATSTEGNAIARIEASKTMPESQGEAKRPSRLAAIQAKKNANTEKPAENPASVPTQTGTPANAQPATNNSGWRSWFSWGTATTSIDTMPTPVPTVTPGYSLHQKNTTDANNAAAAEQPKKRERRVPMGIM